jgi:hypothetical protein
LIPVSISFFFAQNWHFESNLNTSQQAMASTHGPTLSSNGPNAATGAVPGGPLSGIGGDLSNIQLAGMDSNQLYSVLKTIPGVIDKVCTLFAKTLNVAICETHSIVAEQR